MIMVLIKIKKKEKKQFWTSLEKFSHFIMSNYSGFINLLWILGEE